VTGLRASKIDLSVVAGIAATLLSGSRPLGVRDAVETAIEIIEESERQIAKREKSAFVVVEPAAGIDERIEFAQAIGIITGASRRPKRAWDYFQRIIHAEPSSFPGLQQSGRVADHSKIKPFRLRMAPTEDDIEEWRSMRENRGFSKAEVERYKDAYQRLKKKKKK
jgi:hypothetical protein